MFLKLGQLVARRWSVILVLWCAALAAAVWIAPPLDSVAQTGEFSFLPESSPSRVAERLFAKAFPNQARASTIAVITRRTEGTLTPADFEFVDADVTASPEAGDSHAASLSERLRRISSEHTPVPADATKDAPADDTPVVTFRDRSVGSMLISPDERATLVIIELPTEFLDAANGRIVDAVEHLLFADEEFRGSIPAGLELNLSGTAVVGRDILRTARESAKATEHLTIILVVVLLILIYRAPLLALVPLLTVFVSVKLTMSLLCWMAGHGWVVLFTGIESYVTVLLYGAGVDYCLFLIARFKEEIDRGIPAETALIDTVTYVGAAIAASAGTVICGIGMMIFAEFGKFRDAGTAIAFGLVIVLLASLTLTPALLRSAGVRVFWPRHRASNSNDITENGGWLQGMWDHIAHALEKRAWWLWLGSLATLLPFAIVGVWYYTDLSYGLLSDLPRTARSVVGTDVVSQHFPEGLTGPVTVLIESPKLDFSSVGGEDSGIDVAAELSQELAKQKADLSVDDVRSVAYPVGGESGLADIRSPAVYRITLDRALDNYVGVAVDDGPSHITRLDLVTKDDPFSRDSIRQLSQLESAIRETWKRVTDAPAQFFVQGPTASIRDLKSVTDRDQVRVNSLATAGVFLILVVLLRRPAVCVYLIVSVLLSYLATLGITHLAFQAIDGSDFAGLDWKVPMFLFTILIAVGEDYNIFLMTRVAEEQERHGRVRGIIHALSCTGRIISSCGIIMAGTFASLAAGSLKGMAQLGFALAVGVLIDTFLVRPILVPAYLVLVEREAFGNVSRWLRR